MLTSKATSYTLAAAVALAMLAGCSGAGSEMTPTPAGPALGLLRQSVPSPAAQDGRLNSILALHHGIVASQPVHTPSFFMPDAKGKALIFVSDQDKAAVDIYLQGKNHKMVGQITGLTFVEGTATDIAGNLYVAPNSAQIFVYAPPYTGAPKLTLSDTGYPNSVAVSASGIVAAANVCSPPSCNAGTGSVTIYSKNSTKPCATIADTTNFARVFGVTFDHTGNLYVGGEGPSPSYTSAVGEIKGGCHTKKIILLSTTIPLSYTWPLHVDKAGRIAIYDRAYGTNTQVIDAYNPPKNGTLGSPVTTTMLTSSYGFDFAFLASGRGLYFTSAYNSPLPVAEYDYPGGGVAESGFTTSYNPFFVSVFPPFVP